MITGLNAFSLSDVIVGQVVYWADPDNELSSGLYTVAEVNRPAEDALMGDAIVRLVGLSGNEVEAPLQDLYDTNAIVSSDGWRALACHLVSALNAAITVVPAAREPDNEASRDFNAFTSITNRLLEVVNEKLVLEDASMANRTIADLVVDGMHRVAMVEKHWEDNTLQFEVQALSAWVDEAVDASATYSGPAAAVLNDGIEAAQVLVSAWNSGDIAEAVTDLVSWQQEAADTLADLGLLPVDAAVVVEVSGGNVSDVSTRGDVTVYVVDYDNGDDDPEAHPVIPGQEGAHGSIWRTGGVNVSSAFVTNVAIVESLED